MMELSWFLLVGTVYVSSCDDATNEFLDLQRSPRANDLALGGCTLGTRTLLFAFP